MELEEGRGVSFSGSLCTQLLPRSTLTILASKNLGAYLFTAMLITTFFFFSKQLSAGVLLWMSLFCSIIATCLRVYMANQNRRLMRLYDNPRNFTSLLPLNLQLTLVDRDFNESDYEALLGLDSDNTNTRGASEEQISRLPLAPYSKKVDADSCSICLENLVKGAKEQVRTLPCSHYFHSDCIDKWLVTCAKCPVCKYDI